MMWAVNVVNAINSRRRPQAPADNSERICSSHTCCYTSGYPGTRRRRNPGREATHNAQSLRQNKDHFIVSNVGVFDLTLDSIFAYDLKLQDRRNGSVQLIIRTAGKTSHEMVRQIKAFLWRLSLQFATEVARTESTPVNVREDEEKISPNAKIKERNSEEIHLVAEQCYSARHPTIAHYSSSCAARFPMRNCGCVLPKLVQ